MSVLTVLQTGSTCLVKINTTVPGGHGYQRVSSGRVRGKSVYITIYDYVFFGPLYKDPT